MSAGSSKPATLQFCCGTAVEVAAAALSAAQVKADAAQARCFIPLFGIVLLRLESDKSRPCALLLSKSVPNRSGVRLRSIHNHKGDRYAYASSFGSCNGLLGSLRLR